MPGRLGLVELCICGITALLHTGITRTGILEAKANNREDDRKKRERPAGGYQRPLT